MAQIEVGLGLKEGAVPGVSCPRACWRRRLLEVSGDDEATGT